MPETKPIGRILVAGAGIAGIRSAIELAETGYKVLLIDSAPYVGGILAKLDYQFPTDHCGMCRMLPMVGREYSSEYCMRKSLYHENIEIMPFTEIKSIQGEPGKFSVELIQKARYVDPDRCNELGGCIEACPVEVGDEFNHGLTTRKAIFQSVPHNNPSMLMVDIQSCTKCGRCVDICYLGAIDLEAQDQIISREVNSLILASGIKLYNTREFEDAKSYTASPDVVSALAFERMISGTGTYDGFQIRRPSDNKPAKNIAWIQCMGSRNIHQKRDYCSSVCCMFALKEAVLAKEKGGRDTKSTIFYMDMRTFGKGFQQYREKAENEHGVRLVRCRVQEVTKTSGNDLQIRYYDPGSDSFEIENFDLVVLSTGQVPFQDHRKWSEITGCELNSLGLLATEQYSKTRLLNSPGIFMCGSLMGFTDISEAMASGIAAAGDTTNFLQTLDVSTIEDEAFVEPETETKKPAQVAVLICKCGEFSRPEGLDIELLLSSLMKHPGVKTVQMIESVCSAGGQQAALDFLKQTECNRLLLGACQPFMYRRTLKDIARKAGFNSSLVQIIDLLGISRRGLHNYSMKDWTLRAISEIKADLEAIKLKPALNMQSRPIIQKAMVVGGGPAGMHAALSLADRGVSVELIEKSHELGGYAGNRIAKTIDGLTPIKTTQELKLKVFEHTMIDVHLNTVVEKTSGSLGHFESKITSLDGEKYEYLHHGAVIVTTGGNEGKTDEYSYNVSPRILTQSECKTGIEHDTLDLENCKDIVMIQCVGSREKGKREYCSRICCMWAIANAIAIKEKNPDIRIFILYRDIMTYGFLERYYTRARELGILFVSYTLDDKPTVEIVDDTHLVTFTESILREKVTIDVDYLILSTGVDPAETNKELAGAFAIPLGNDGFFEEADPKWRPVEFRQQGVFLAGAAHAPVPLPDVLMQAEAAAQRAYSYLSAQELLTARVVSTVRDSLCIRCQRCVAVCPYEARSYDPVEHRIIVDSAACQGCGMCAVACRNNAAEVPGWSDQQTLAVIDQKLMDDFSFTTSK